MIDGARSAKEVRRFRRARYPNIRELATAAPHLRNASPTYNSIMAKKITLKEIGDMLAHVVKHMATKDDIAIVEASIACVQEQGNSIEAELKHGRFESRLGNLKRGSAVSFGWREANCYTGATMPSFVGLRKFETLSPFMMDLARGRHDSLWPLAAVRLSAASEGRADSTEIGRRAACRHWLNFRILCPAEVAAVTTRIAL